MGNILTCFHSSRDKSKSSSSTTATNTTNPSQSLNNPQTLSSEIQDVHRGLRDEHLASIPPPSTAEDIAGESRDVTRNVGVTAPVPVPTPSSVSNTHTSNHTNGENRQAEKGEMASDEDYMAFLDKANRDPNEGTAKEESNGRGTKIELKATDKGASVPQVLKKATEEAFYVSDADEPFVPVCLKHSGKGLPDEVAFAKLVSHPSPDEAEVEIMDVAEWDTQGQYKELVDAVREASKGSDVRVYRIGKGGSRVEYWVVGIEGGKLVGVKALAIES